MNEKNNEKLDLSFDDLSREKVWVPAPLPSFERERLKELHDLQLLDTESEAIYNEYTQLASKIFDVPIVLISLIDENRQWFKSACGLGVTETERDVSFCGYAIREAEILVVPDALESEIFSLNPLVVGEPFIRFYAGAVLRGPHGYPIGTFCLIDTKPHVFDQSQQDLLLSFGRIVEHELQNRVLLQRIFDKLGEQSFYTTLTNLPNRRLFQDWLTTSHKKQNNGLAVISLMIKNFTEIKNAFGQHIANEILKELAERLKKTLDSNSHLSHCEENQFLFFIEERRKKNDLDTQVYKLVAAIEEIFEDPFLSNQIFFESDKRPGRLCGAIGISLSLAEDSNPQALIENATSAMHDNPLTGTTYHFFEKTNLLALASYFDMENRLYKAIKNGELTLEYQPIVDTQTGKIYGAEALCRWTDSQKIISPATFISVAEKSGLIVPLGEWVLTHACQQMQKWKVLGFGDLYISVNVGKEQLEKKDFVSMVEKALKNSGVLPQFLKLEITESSFIDDFDHVRSVMNKLISKGVTFSIDDFGTGYSSLSFLHNLPISTLKIDRSFVKLLSSKKTKTCLVKNIVLISKNLGMSIVAEGVETYEQFDILKAYGCDYIQGYLFSRPLTPQKMEEFLSRGAVI